MVADTSGGSLNWFWRACHHGHQRLTEDYDLVGDQEEHDNGTDRHLNYPDMLLVIPSWRDDSARCNGDREVDTMALFMDAFKDRTKCAANFPKMEACRLQEKTVMSDLREAVCMDLMHFFRDLRGLECEPFLSSDKGKIFLRVTLSDFAAEGYAAQSRLKLRTTTQLIDAMGIDQDPKKISPTWLEFEQVNYKKWLQRVRRELGADFELYKRYDDQQIDECEEDMENNGATTSSHGSIFRPVDRIALIYDILHEEINLSRLVKAGVLDDYYPNHDERKIQKFTQRWANIKLVPDARKQPLTDLNNYFGLNLAFWFAWQGHTVWTVGLMVPFSIIFFLVRTFSPTLALYAHIGNVGMVMVWTIYYRKSWVRKENALKMEWGLMNGGDDLNLRARPDYYGEKRPAPWDRKRMVRTYPSWKKRLAEAFSAATTVVFIVLVLLMVAYFLSGEFTRWMKSLGAAKHASTISGITLSVQIKVFRAVWGYGIVPWLVYLENPRTDEEYLNSLVFKLVPFNFINSYYSFFYVAFFKEFAGGGCSYKDGSHTHGDCGRELEDLLYVTYGVLFLINFADLLVPLVWVHCVRLYRYGWSYMLTLLKMEVNMESLDSRSAMERSAEKPKISQDDQQRDFLAVVLELGYAVLFGSAAPIIFLPCWVLLLVGLRLTAWRYTNIYQRIRPVFVPGIGAWDHMLSLLLNFGRVSAVAVAVLDLRELDFLETREKLVIVIVVKLVVDLVEALVDAAIVDLPKLSRQQVMMRNYVEKKWRRWTFEKADLSRTGRLVSRARRISAWSDIKSLFHHRDMIHSPTSSTL
mmetsp:Transcript_31930/g.74757  ORF Transcript_31930/g.74757 Transcript_31930/m.74757 type:complete len:808 (+) Transcript_31930:79-2502(+)|eukprot:CAMPEP_0178390722 /NCGR_PEP_ID=MMETSP0689_2-20121128/10792_1 /TAXON_ID=160604 /ORGANISM="Amphidinium massartii, Strain CS-259" /LENGTH=807 /DNA_ID=CAMNT_0020011239 /DNA_START=8 /DNA_END=2431 /DNA_ORIENTATION=+